MASTKLGFINTSVLIVSFFVFAFSVSSMGLYGHVTYLLDKYARAGWTRWDDGYDTLPDGSYTPRTILKPLIYDEGPRNAVWATAAFGITAGLVGLWSWFEMRGGRNLSARFSRILTSLSISSAAAVFISALVTFAYAFDRENPYKSFECAGYHSKDLRAVYCTREMLVCQRVLPYWTEVYHNWEGRACSEARSARWLMVPTFVFSLALVTLYTVRVWLLNGSPKDVDNESEE